MKREIFGGIFPQPYLLADTDILNLYGAFSLMKKEADNKKTRSKN